MLPMAPAQGAQRLTTKTKRASILRLSERPLYNNNLIFVGTNGCENVSLVYIYIYNIIYILDFGKDTCECGYAAAS
jgi:hypothetical protein